MTRKYPVAVWQDAGGTFTATVLDGAAAAATDLTAADALIQLKKYLAWVLRQDGIGLSDFDDLALRDHRIRIRPEYAAADSVFPVSTPFQLRITCVHGRRKDDTRHCVIPTLDVRFSYQAGDPIEELVTEAVQQKLGKRTPQELSRELMPARIMLDAVHIRDSDVARKPEAPRRPNLEAVAEPLGRRARGVRFPRAIQRDGEVRNLVERLTRDKANLLLVGESGVGKTTVLAEAVRQVLRAKAGQGESLRRVRPAADPSPILAHQRPAADRRHEIPGPMGGALRAGDRGVGGMRRRAVCRKPAGTGARGGRDAGASVAAFLMPYLQRGELRIVAEATASELDACRRLLPGLADLLQVVRIPEFSPADARTVLAALLDEGGRNHKLDVGEGLADVIYRLFQRFQPYAAFPGRAAGFVRHLIDEAAQSADKQLSQADVLVRFQRDTGLPQRLLRDDLPLPHDEVLAEFRSDVLGQETACQTAAAVVTSLKTGLNDPRRPLGVLLFCGPTGVGKTEMAKALARRLFGAGAASDRLVRLDMSEYAGYGAAQRLLLSADGQVSDFIKKLRRQPFVVVLLDEIEKAAAEVHDALLGVLDEGRLTDRFGRTTTFNSSVIVMTSNLGAERSASIGYGDPAQPAFERIAMNTFRPEFYNRIDAVVTFQPLSRETIEALARRELESLSRRDGLTKAGLRLIWPDDVITHLASIGYDARYGARPLQRAIERHIAAPLSAWLLAHPGTRDRTLTLRLAEEKQIVVDG